MQQPAQTRRELLARIDRDRSWFAGIIGRIPRERLDEPSLPGGWSVKDVLAHIAWGHRQGAGAARARALVGSELWALPQDERNAVEREESRSKTLDEVMDGLRESAAELRAGIEGLTDEELNEPERMCGLAQRIPGWRPWRVLYDPRHYAEHGRTIEEWLAGGSRR